MVSLHLEGPLSQYPYVTSSEGARMLGYTIQHVRRLVTEGRLDGFKHGRDWLILRASVEALAARKEYLELPLELQEHE